jgi:hypothetical protein
LTSKLLLSADKIDLSDEEDVWRDYKFVKWLSKNHKLLGIPPSAFFSKDHKSIGEDYIRFCFIKVTLFSGVLHRIPEDPAPRDTSLFGAAIHLYGYYFSARRQPDEGGTDLDRVETRARREIVLNPVTETAEFIFRILSLNKK